MAQTALSGGWPTYTLAVQAGELNEGGHLRRSGAALIGMIARRSRRWRTGEEVPFTGLPLAILIASGGWMMGAGLTLRMLARSWE